MIEYSFIYFTQEIDCGCSFPIPVMYGSDLAFFADNTIDEIAFCTTFGKLIKIASDRTIMANHVVLWDDISKIMAKRDCFRLRYKSGENYYYSNNLIYIGCENYEETSLLEYRCNEDEFGFVYSLGDVFNKVRLPIRLFSAQFPQEDNVYITRSGERKVLYAKVNKEWMFETDYLPEELHQKIIIALSHDEVYINGERVQKSDKYELDWDSVLKSDCGDCVKGTCKMQQNKTLRNSNCG